jgi:hypothetical protein
MITSGNKQKLGSGKVDGCLLKLSPTGIHRCGRCDQMASIHPIIALNWPILHADD